MDREQILKASVNNIKTNIKTSLSLFFFQDFVYSRLGSPSRLILEKAIATLEDGEYGKFITPVFTARCFSPRPAPQRPTEGLGWPIIPPRWQVDDMFYDFIEKRISPISRKIELVSIDCLRWAHDSRSTRQSTHAPPSCVLEAPCRCGKEPKYNTL